MSSEFQIQINGKPRRVGVGTTVAAAVLAAGVPGTRTSVTGQARAPLCAMGICYECRLTIDGVAHRLSCQVVCQEGMEVQTNG
jgi:predicted molibdopterin-dependent oxidoreductase YjgC